MQNGTNLDLLTAGSADVTATTSTAPAAANSALARPAPKPGYQTTQLWLLVGVIALLVATVFAGKLDAAWSALITPVLAVIYLFVRENVYANAAAHPDDALDGLLGTILNALPEPSAEHVPALIAALRTQPAQASLTAASQASANQNQPTIPNTASQSGQAAMRTLAILALGSWLLLTGCAALAKFQSDPRVQFAEQEALKIGVAALQQYSNGGSFDSMWGISEGLYAFTDTISSITAQHPDAPNSALAVQLAQTVQSYASTKDTKALAGQLAAIITKANPQTDAQRVQVVNAIAGQLQAAATITKPSSSDGKTATSPTQSARIGKGRWQMAKSCHLGAHPDLRTAISGRKD